MHVCIYVCMYVMYIENLYGVQYLTSYLDLYCRSGGLPCRERERERERAREREMHQGR